MLEKEMIQWMGQKVSATPVHTVRDAAGTVMVSPTPTVVRGWVVGFTHRRSGKTVTDYFGSRVFVAGGSSYQVSLVRPWPWMKSVDVDPDSLVLLDENDDIVSPAAPSAVARKALSVQARSQPRDNNGRFRKKFLSDDDVSQRVMERLGNMTDEEGGGYSLLLRQGFWR